MGSNCISSWSLLIIFLLWPNFNAQHILDVAATSCSFVATGIPWVPGLPHANSASLFFNICFHICFQLKISINCQQKILSNQIKK